MKHHATDIQSIIVNLNNLAYPMPTLKTVHQHIRVFQIRSLIEGKNKTQDPRDP